MRFVFLTVFLLVLFSVFSQRERYNFSQLDTYTGLSHNQVNTILKDTDGFCGLVLGLALIPANGFQWILFSAGAI